MINLYFPISPIFCKNLNWPQWDTMGYSGSLENLIHEKNLKSLVRLSFPPESMAQAANLPPVSLTPVVIFIDHLFQQWQQWQICYHCQPQNATQHHEFDKRRNTSRCREVNIRMDTNISGNTRSKTYFNNSRIQATAEKPIAAWCYNRGDANNVEHQNQNRCQQQQDLSNIRTLTTAISAKTEETQTISGASTTRETPN